MYLKKAERYIKNDKNTVKSYRTNSGDVYFDETTLRVIFTNN